MPSEGYEKRIYVKTTDDDALLPVDAGQASECNLTHEEIDDLRRSVLKSPGSMSET